MRTGFFGGTFDPPHLGHLIIAESLRSHLDLDRVLWIPAAVSPHKLDADSAGAFHRSRMVELAIADNPSFEFCDIELRRAAPSYTVDSLDELTQRYPSDTFFLLIGMDSLAGFHTWREPHRIRRLATVVAYPRIRVDPPDEIGDTLIVDLPIVEISSTQVRSLVGAGGSIRYLVTEPVRQYIEQEGLYK
ncbi:MAG: nicotinate (nicotinamide) nucleotide adenylyltransferase [Rhodothermales bacterium]|nr:nicotinate (nicotinamide) nucleotide adenylyltransferase [Rhodothermales bacterium]